MNLPKIDLASLPDLGTMTGLFGSSPTQTPGHDDTIIMLAVMVYDAVPPPASFF